MIDLFFTADNKKCIQFKIRSKIACTSEISIYIKICMIMTEFWTWICFKNEFEIILNDLNAFEYKFFKFFKFSIFFIILKTTEPNRSLPFFNPFSMTLSGFEALYKYLHFLWGNFHSVRIFKIECSVKVAFSPDKRYFEPAVNRQPGFRPGVLCE